MDWVKEGMRAAQSSPDRWEEIGEGHHRQACVERDVLVKTLEYAGAGYKQQEREILAELQTTPQRPFVTTVISVVESIGFGVAAFFLIRAGYQFVFASLPLIGMSGEANESLAWVLAGGSAVAFELLFRLMAQILPDSSARTCRLFIVLTAAMLLVTSAATQSFLRSEHDSAKSALDILETAAPQSNPPNASQPDGDFKSIVGAFHRRSRHLTDALNLLATVGLELGGAMALHECLSRFTPALNGILLLLGLRRIRRQLVRCAMRIEQAKNRPQLIKEQFHRGVMLHLGKQQYSPGDTLEDESRDKWLTIKILVFVAVFFAAYLLFLSRVFAVEMVVVVPDLTESSAGAPMTKNFRAIDEIIWQLKPGARLAILPITERSFSNDPILDATLPAEAGLLGERVKSSRQKLLERWWLAQKALKTDSQKSDIFGVLMRASFLIESGRPMKPYLILLSDMRHVSREYNFESMARIDAPLIHKLEKDELVAPLAGVKVWALGVHAAGVSDSYWMSLKKFWQIYFKRSGAELKAFSPDRRWSNE